MKTSKTTSVEIIIFILGLGLILYFGYRDDFRRAPRKAAFLILVVGGMILVFILLSRLDTTLGLLAAFGVGISAKGIWKSLGSGY